MATDSGMRNVMYRRLETFLRLTTSITPGSRWKHRRTVSSLRFQRAASSRTVKCRSKAGVTALLPSATRVFSSSSGGAGCLVCGPIYRHLGYAVNAKSPSGSNGSIEIWRLARTPYRVATQHSAGRPPVCSSVQLTHPPSNRKPSARDISASLRLRLNSSRIWLRVRPSCCLRNSRRMASAVGSPRASPKM